jgi:hypothetical protein
MTAPTDQTGFDADYVKKLREEAADWRTKFRGLEAQSLYKDVNLELVSQGIKADPTWVQMIEGQSVKEAVEGFKTKYPHLATQPTTQVVVPAPTMVPASTTPATPVVPTTPQVLQVVAPGTENQPDPLKARGLDEIKKDPVARSRLRDLYRAKLAEGSNQPPHKY